MRTETRQAISIIAALIFLRVIVGLHFVYEGTSKIRAGDFDAKPFLAGAIGPAARFFHGLIDDCDGRIRLSVEPGTADEINPRRTLAIWEEFARRCKDEWEAGAENARAIDKVVARNRANLEALLDGERIAIQAWLRGESRLDGFSRDLVEPTRASSEVASLAEQVRTIARSRDADAAPWFAAIQAMWDDVEASIHDVGQRMGRSPIALARPFSPPGSPHWLINRFLPWFDVVTGALLLIGLMTRLAATAGMSLLAGIVVTQPFWVPGAQLTYDQWIELAALAVIFTTRAGQFGGLDYFLMGWRSRRSGDRSLQNSLTPEEGAIT